MDHDSRRFREIKEHFSLEAGDFDALIAKRAPFYDLFVKALVNVLPFRKDKTIRVADLGCGSGTISFFVKDVFPNARIDCVDFSPAMLDAAKKKLSGFTGISYYECDVLQFDLTGYDAVLSSLCLHHIGEEKQKRDFFRKVHQGLLEEGVFYIYDVILASNKAVQDVYIEEWKKFMGENLSSDDVEKTIQNYRDEDRPFSLMNELKRLEAAGFKDVDVICKFYNGAVYGGVKGD
jgi:ubiquinone/menaquinone biosynthesis C-methylase UbiE